MNYKPLFILSISVFLTIRCNKTNVVIIKDNNGKTIQKGRLDSDGFKKGLWTYNYGDELYEIVWDYIYNDSISYNIPLDWEKLIEVAGNSYYGKIGKTKGQIVYNIYYDKNKHEYNDMSNIALKLKYDVLKEYSKPVINGNKEHLFSKYTLRDKKTKKTYFVYNFCAEIGENKGVFGISYFFKDTNWQKHSVFFIDYIYSFKFKNNFLLEKTKVNKGSINEDNSFFGWKIEVE